VHRCNSECWTSVHRCNSECWTISLTHTHYYLIQKPPGICSLQACIRYCILHTPSCIIWHSEQQKYIKHFPNCPCCCLHVPCHNILLASFPLKHNIQFFTSIPRCYTK
jgi:hypothetical protein